MTVVVCVDDKLGMTFCGRRQSTDASLRRRLLSLFPGKKIYSDEYTASQFEDSSLCVVCERPDLLWHRDAVYFAEKEDVSVFGDMIDRLVIYRWNRRYPADEFLSFDPLREGMRLERISEFEGSSHSHITEEIWSRQSFGSGETYEN